MQINTNFLKSEYENALDLFSQKKIKKKKKKAFQERKKKISLFPFQINMVGKNAPRKGYEIWNVRILLKIYILN